MCRWGSTIPGMRMPPWASISIAPSGTGRLCPTAAIVSPMTSTSPPLMTPAPSMVSTLALRKTSGRPLLTAAISSGFIVSTSGCGWLVVSRLGWTGLAGGAGCASGDVAKHGAPAQQGRDRGDGPDGHGGQSPTDTPESGEPDRVVERVLAGAGECDNSAQTGVDDRNFAATQVCP